MTSIFEDLNASSGVMADFQNQVNHEVNDGEGTDVPDVDTKEDFEDALNKIFLGGLYQSLNNSSPAMTDFNKQSQTVTEHNTEHKDKSERNVPAEDEEEEETLNVLAIQTKESMLPSDLIINEVLASGVSRVALSTPTPRKKVLALSRSDVLSVTESPTIRKKQLEISRSVILSVTASPTVRKKKLDISRTDTLLVCESPTVRKKELAVSRTETLSVSESPLARRKKIGVSKSDTISIVAEDVSVTSPVASPADTNVTEKTEGSAMSLKTKVSSKWNKVREKVQNKELVSFWKTLFSEKMEKRRSSVFSFCLRSLSAYIISM